MIFIKMNYFKITYKPILCHLYDVNEHFRWYVYNILFLQNLQNLSYYNVSYDFNLLTNLFNNKKIHYNIDNCIRFDCQKLSEYINDKIETCLKSQEKDFISNNSDNNNPRVSASPPRNDFEYKIINNSKSDIYNVIKYTIYISLYSSHNNMCYLFVEIPIYSYINRGIFHMRHLCEFDKMTRISYKKSKNNSTNNSPNPSESPTMKALNSTLSSISKLIEKQPLHQTQLTILKNLRYLVDDYEDNKHHDPDMTNYYNLFIQQDSITFGGKKYNVSENYITMIENSNLLMNTLIKVMDLNILPKMSSKFKNIYEFKITSTETIEQSLFTKMSNLTSMIPSLSL